MQVERLEEMRLTADEEAQINALILAAFDDSFGDRSFHQQRHHVRLVVREANEIIGHMAICYRAIRLSSQLVTVAGLAEVAVSPSHRGKGIAGAMLTAAIAEVERTQAKFFILFGNRPIYAGRGFEVASNRVKYTDMTGANTVAISLTSDSDLMVMAMGDEPWNGALPVDLLGSKF
ncbi:MAG: putative N-acetyltransferase YhbS [Yoonia sp.]|jgi:predicted N-acetyltransferase YhbS